MPLGSLGGVVSEQKCEETQIFNLKELVCFYVQDTDTAHLNSQSLIPFHPLKNKCIRAVQYYCLLTTVKLLSLCVCVVWELYLSLH